MPAITRSKKIKSTTVSLQQNPDTAIIVEVNKSTAMADITPQIPVTEVTNAELQSSLQTVLTLVTQTNLTMNTITADVQTIKLDITSIKEITNESEGIKEQLYTTQGKLTRLELKNQKLQEKVLSLENQQYSHDLMFYNVKDADNEPQQELKNTALFTRMLCCVL